MAITTVPLLPCAAPDATVAFYEALGFTTTHRQDRPYLYLAFVLDDIEVHFKSASPGLDSTEENTGGFLALVDDVAPVHRRFIATLRSRLGRVPATGLPRLTRLREGQTRFCIFDPSGNCIVVVNRDEPDVEYGGSPALSGLAKAHDNVRIFRDFKNDDALAARALDVALRRHGADASRLDLARAHADRAELAMALGDRAQADESRSRLTALALTDDEKTSLSVELDALEQIEDWMRGA